MTVKLPGDKFPWMTFVMAVIAIIITIVGGVIAATNSDALSFQDYIDALWKLALAVAGLGIGRGIHGGSKAVATAIKPQPPAVSPETAATTQAKIDAQ